MKGSSPTNKCSPGNLGLEVAEQTGDMTRLIPACTPTHARAARAGDAERYALFVMLHLDGKFQKQQYRKDSVENTKPGGAL